MSTTTAVPAPELPDVNTDQLVRLLRVLLEGYVPKEHSIEAEVLMSAIETHVQQMGRRLIGESFGVGAATAVAMLREHDARNRVEVPADFIRALLIDTPDQTH